MGPTAEGKSGLTGKSPTNRSQYVAVLSSRANLKWMAKGVRKPLVATAI
jgi:hypothetical protein